MKNRLVLLALFTLFFHSCKEDISPDPEPQLPPITSEGLNTFGCLVDGELFVAGRGKEKYWNPLVLEYDHYKDSIFSLYGRDYKANKVILLETIYYKGDKKVNLYNPNSADYSGITKLVDHNIFGGLRYVIDKNAFWDLDIIKDDNSTISGTFYFDAICNDIMDTIHITQGRFDVAK